MKNLALALLILICPVWASAQAMGAVGTYPVPTNTPTHGKVPKIIFTHPTYDFGNRDEGGDIVHYYTFYNQGRDTLRISGVHASCGCTAAVTDSDALPPGGMGRIKATYHTQGRPGKAIKTITVNTNDPNNPNVTLTFNVNVVREVDMQPDRVYFFGVKKGESRAATVTVLGKPGKTLEISGLEVRDKKVQATSAPITQSTDPKELPRTGASIVVTLPADLPIGEVQDEIKFKTTDPKKPEATLPVSGEIVGRVQAFPKSLSLGNSTQPATVTLGVNPPEGFVIRNITTEKRLIKPFVLRQPQVNGAPQYQVAVTPPDPKSLPVGDWKDAILLTTNDPEQKEVRIEVQGTRNP